MDKFELSSKVEIGSLKIENFDAVKNNLEQYLQRYKHTVYTEDDIKLAKLDRRDLNRVRNQLDDARKMMKKKWMEPYNVFENQIKELQEMIKPSLKEVTDIIYDSEDKEKDTKRKMIEHFAKENSKVLLGNLTNSVVESSEFIDKKWLNKSTPVKEWQPAVINKIQKCSKDLQTIQLIGGKYQSTLIQHYLKTLSLDDIEDYRNQLVALDVNIKHTNSIKTDSKDARIGYKIFKLNGTDDQIAEAREVLSLIGIEIEEIEDGMS